MTITTQHLASSYGIPVILDDAGELLDPGPGTRAVLARLGWTQIQFANACGVRERTVTLWLSGKLPVPANALNVLRDALELARAQG